jgi:hypothetical protein
MDPMTRRIEVLLDKRGARCVARLLDELAPRTCDALWNALPQSGAAYHAKYARNEIYALVPAFADPEPPHENTTITPIPGDLVYFPFEPWQLAPMSHGYADPALHGEARSVDIALFYNRNNLLLNPDFGWVPGNVFATIEEGLAEIAAAAQDLWRHGATEETLSFRRAER